MSSYRRSDYRYDDYSGGERWDRDRFERVRARSRGPSGSSESFRYEEDDRYYDRGAGGRRDLRVEVMEDDRRRSNDDRYYDDYRHSSPRYRSDYYEDDRYRVSGREVAPYRPNDRESDRYPSRGPDPYDRRPKRGYAEERDVNVNVNVRPPTPPSREYNYSPPRRDYYEEDYDDLRIRREREHTTYHRDSRYDQYPEPQSPSTNRRGRTRMPKRLAHRSALIQKGYPFEDETDFYVVRIALSKDQIDEVIKISESYFHEEKLSIRVEETKALPAPESESHHSHDSNDDGEEARETEVVETVTTKVIDNPTEEDLEKYDHIGEKNNESSSESEEEQPRKSEHQSHHTSHHSKHSHRSSRRSSQAKESASRSTYRGRSHSRANKDEIVIEEARPSSDNALVLPDRSSTQRRSGQDQIIRVEKDDRERGKFIAPRSPDNERDRDRSRSRRRVSGKVVNAAMFSLT